MEKTTKIWLIIAASLVAIGLIAFVATMAVNGWDFTKLGTGKYETNTYEITEEFRNISIKTDTADIAFAPSDDGKCKVVCYEEENLKHSVSAIDGALTVKVVDTRKWYEHIGINFGNQKITVYLPEGEYSSLIIEESTGDIEIPKAFNFVSIDISTSTGDVKSFASASELIKIKTSTGDVSVEKVSAGAIDLSTSTGNTRLADIMCKSVTSSGSTGDIILTNVIAAEGVSVERSTGNVKFDRCEAAELYVKTSTGKVTVSNVTCEGDVKVSVSTGKTYLTDVTCKSVTSNGDTGDISMENVIAAEKVSIERDTGDVRFDGCDAAEIFVETDTGNVTGTLLSEKVFITRTDTGNVNVPKTITGGRCEITTDTGNIEIEVASR